MELHNFHHFYVIYSFISLVLAQLLISNSNMHQKIVGVKSYKTYDCEHSSHVTTNFISNIINNKCPTFYNNLKEFKRRIKRSKRCFACVELAFLYICVNHFSTKSIIHELPLNLPWPKGIKNTKQIPTTPPFVFPLYKCTSQTF